MLQRPELDISSFTVEGQTRAQATEQAHKDLMKEVPKKINEQMKKAQQIKVIDSKEKEEATKRIMMQKIELYFQRFPWLGSKVPKVRGSTIPELQFQLDCITRELNGQKSLENIHKYIGTGFSILENAWGDGSGATFVPPALRLNLTNLSALFTKGAFNDEIMPLVAELDIEYPWLGRQSLGMRVLQTVSHVLLTVHLVNTNPVARKMMAFEGKQPMENPVLEELSKEDEKEK